MRLVFTLCILFISFISSAQYTHADSLRGGYGEARDWWDITRYELDVAIDMDQRSVSGSNHIFFKFESGKFGHLRKYNISWMQIDLQAPMILDSIVVPNFGTYTEENLRHEGNAYIMRIPKTWISPEGGNYDITVYYHGIPKEALNPPWDGGAIWQQDVNGKPWMSIACQGIGASVWFPCKDSQADKPDNVKVSYTIPSQFVCVGNGRLTDKTVVDSLNTKYTWEVKNPISNYNIIPYIGDYVEMTDTYIGEKGKLSLDYWVIRGNEDMAKKQFKEVPRMLEAFEHWFGPYPFYEDGYKLVEAPHLGMEHQSAIAYGNDYQNGYNGKDLSETGVGLKWDFIIVHESGHEWFGNSVTSKDIADLWIHEAFTSYSEILFMEYWHGKADAQTYLIGIRNLILNDRPMIGEYNVNHQGSRDMYYKGSNMIHSLRRSINNDSIFRAMLRQINTTFSHKVITSQQLESFIGSYLGKDMTFFFDKYLRTTEIPELELVYSKNSVKYRWLIMDPAFDMPIYMTNFGWIHPKANFQKISYKSRLPLLDPNFYVKPVISITKDFRNFREPFFAKYSETKD